MKYILISTNVQCPEEVPSPMSQVQSPKSLRGECAEPLVFGSPNQHGLWTLDLDLGTLDVGLPS